MNYAKAMKTKTEACDVAYQVLAEVKTGNHISKFSIAMYELYRNELRGHYQGPVVQSIISLTSSLRGQLVKCFMTL